MYRAHCPLFVSTSSVIVRADRISTRPCAVRHQSCAWYRGAAALPPLPPPRETLRGAVVEVHDRQATSDGDGPPAGRASTRGFPLLRGRPASAARSRASGGATLKQKQRQSLSANRRGSLSARRAGDSGGVAAQDTLSASRKASSVYAEETRKLRGSRRGKPAAKRGGGSARTSGGRSKAEAMAADFFDSLACASARVRLCVPACKWACFRVCGCPRAARWGCRGVRPCGLLVGRVMHLGCCASLGVADRSVG